MHESLNILLVEDDEVDRMAVRRALHHAGAAGSAGAAGPAGTSFVVRECDSATRIADVLRSERFDCVLLDHHLPDGDSLAILKTVRTAGARVPVIVFTGQGDEQLAVDLMKAGASDYLVKGKVSPEHLAQSIRAAVRVHRAEMQADAAAREKDQAVALLNTLVGEAPVGIAFFDTALRYVMVNDALARINGFPVEAHIGKTISEMLPNLDSSVERDLRQVIESGQPIDNIEVTGRTPADPDTDHYWIASYYPVRSRSGLLLGAGVTAIDVTERKRFERELAAAKEAAEAANIAKDQFLAVLSHELRTPLTPVLVAVQALQESKSAPDLDETFAMIRRNVELEARLIDDLLDLTRIARGKLQLHLEPCDAHILLCSALDICRPDLAAKGLQVVVDLKATRTAVVADQARLQQVFWNLINNSVKFTPGGGTLTVRTFDDEDRIVVQLADTGIGIEPEILPRIFDAFEQGEGAITRKFGGLGLGLAICRALVRMHWGQINAASAGRGKGATFTVKLAAKPGHASPVPPTLAPECETEPEPAAAATAAGAAPPVDAGPARVRRILMVDDHEDTRFAMQRMLERSGYQVKTAGTVRAAIETAAGEPFDVLISDIGLPDGSGLDIMRHVRGAGACGAGGDRPIRGIALSGFGMEEDIRRSKEAGFDHHLTKPISFDRLHALLKQIEVNA